MPNDEFDAKRKALANWKEKVPAELSSGTAIEAIGKLKRDGHIRSITLVNSLPRSASTVVTKALGSSDSLNLPGNMVFHEILNDSKETSDPATGKMKKKSEMDGYSGSDVLMGKLLELGVLENKASGKGADLVLKVMSDEFTGGELKSFLPYVDNVLSTIREPARHINCVALQFAFQDEATYDEVAGILETAWKKFKANIDMIAAWQAAHPGQKLQHALISADNLIQSPENIMRYICTEFSKGNHPIAFNQAMIHKWKPEVFDPNHDWWARNEKKSTAFAPVPYSRITPEELGAFKAVYDTTAYPVFEDIIKKYPYAGQWTGSTVLPSAGSHVARL